MGGGDEFRLGQVAFELLVGHQSGERQRTETGSETQVWKPWSAAGDSARGVRYGHGRMLREKKACDAGPKAQGISSTLRKRSLQSQLS